MTLDPIASAVLRSVERGPATTDEVAARLSDAGEIVSRRRLSVVLHGLREAGHVTIRRHCRIGGGRLNIRQEWTA